MRFNEWDLSVLRQRLPEYIWRVHGIRVRPGQPFHCFLHGEDKHPSMAYYSTARNGRQRPHVHCFACGADADLFQLVQVDYGLTDFPSVVRKAQEILGQAPAGVQGGSSPFHPGERLAAVGCNAAPRVARAKDYRRFVMANAQNISMPVPSSYLERRGISLETATRHHLGYFAEYNSRAGGAWPSGALIIPTQEPGGLTGFVARNPSGQGERFRFGCGCRGLFNWKPDKWLPGMPVFVTEGAFDALAIMEAGGNAIGLNSCENVQTFLSLVASKPNALANRVVVAWLDNDPAGQEATGTLRAGLESRGVPCLSPILGRFGLAQMKDPNQALTERQDGFRQAVREGNELLAWDRYTATMAWTG